MTNRLHFALWSAALGIAAACASPDEEPVYRYRAALDVQTPHSAVINFTNTDALQANAAFSPNTSPFDPNLPATGSCVFRATTPVNLRPAIANAGTIEVHDGSGAAQFSMTAREVSGQNLYSLQAGEGSLPGGFLLPAEDVRVTVTGSAEVPAIEASIPNPAPPTVAFPASAPRNADLRIDVASPGAERGDLFLAMYHSDGSHILCRRGESESTVTVPAALLGMFPAGSQVEAYTSAFNVVYEVEGDWTAVFALGSASRRVPDDLELKST